jgi:DNA invertase Pin-like site-specific DNA recombinase
VLEYARSGDVIVVHTLDRLGRTVRDTLNLIHDLAGRGVGIRNLADPIRVDSANPDDPMAQLAVVMLALFAQMERTYMLERVAHARSVAVAKGRQVGRPVTVDAGKLDYARRLRDEDGLTLAEIVERTGLPRTTLYRHLPPRPAQTSPDERNSSDPGAVSVSRPAAGERTGIETVDGDGILQVHPPAVGQSAAVVHPHCDMPVLGGSGVAVDDGETLVA